MNSTSAARAAKLARMAAFAAAIAGLGPTDASALSLSLSPATQTVAPGGTALVDIVAADVLPLGLGGYSLTMTFDPSILAFSSASSHLPGATIGLAASIGTGQVTLSDLSFEEPDDLIGMEQASFTLASVRYTATGSGTASVGISSLDLADAFGAPLAAAVPGGVAVTVSPVPEPAAGLYLLGGVAALGAIARRRSAGR